MPYLCAHYMAFLNDEGLSVVDSYQADRLKLCLPEHFGEKLVSFGSAKRVTAPEPVAAKSVPQEALLEHAAEVIHTTQATQDSMDVDAPSCGPGPEVAGCCCFGSFPQCAVLAENIAFSDM